MIELIRNISFEELALREGLPKIMVSALQAEGLDSLSKVLDYYKEHGDFYKIRYYGVGKSKKLEAFCLKYLDEIIYVDEIVEQNQIIYLINSFSEFKTKVFYYQITHFISKLNPRLTKIFEQLFREHTMLRIMEIIFVENINFINFRNIGVTSLNEWEAMKKEIANFAIRFDAMTNNEVLITYFTTYSIRNFQTKKGFDGSNFGSIISQNGEIKLFAFINLIIENDFLFNKIEKYFFDLFFVNTTIKNITYYKISKVFDKKAQAVSKIIQRMIANLYSRFDFISQLDIKEITHNYIDTSKNFIVVDQEMVQRINVQEGVAFNLEFYGYVLRIYYQDTHVLIPKLKIDLKKEESHFFYLVSLDMFNSFTFYGFMEKIKALSNYRHKRRYYLPLKNIIAKFVRKSNKIALEEISEACKIITQKTFQIPLENNLNLVFEKVSIYTLKDYVYEILQDRGRAMSYLELFKALQKKVPNRIYMEDSIRSIITNDKELFICFSRSGTYGLKKWEKSKRNIKGGSIRSMVVEFLEKHDTPMYMEDIVQYVLRFRNSNSHSVTNNIQQDESKIFRIFNGLFIGLTSKTYDEKKLSYKRLCSLKFNLSKFKTLIGLSKNEVILHFVSNYGYTPSQVDYMIKLKINNHDITFSEDNILMSVADPKPSYPRKPRQKKSK